MTATVTVQVRSGTGIRCRLTMSRPPSGNGRGTEHERVEEFARPWRAAEVAVAEAIWGRQRVGVREHDERQLAVGDLDDERGVGNPETVVPDDSHAPVPCGEPPERVRQCVARGSDRS